MERQESSLLDMLDVTIGKLVNLEQLVPMLGRLGAEHAIAHHVTSDMYTAVGSALLETLRMVLGEAWTDEVRASWVKVYEIVQDVMIAGGDEALAAKRRAEFVSA